MGDPIVMNAEVKFPGLYRATLTDRQGWVWEKWVRPGGVILDLDEGNGKEIVEALVGGRTVFFDDGEPITREKPLLKTGDIQLVLKRPSL
ncbi:MAG: hypothetical protein ACXABY_00830 [Candidatus Thorarchaeota archaeon]|jgi:hypothetical protein